MYPMMNTQLREKKVKVKESGEGKKRDLPCLKEDGYFDPNV